MVKRDQDWRETYFEGADFKYHTVLLKILTELIQVSVKFSSVAVNLKNFGYDFLKVP